jgi:membrane protease YdiL (CAAX protease family)
VSEHEPEALVVAQPAPVLRRFPGFAAAVLLLVLALVIQVWIVAMAAILHGVLDIAWLDPYSLYVIGLANLVSMAAVLLIGITGSIDTFRQVVGGRMVGPLLFFAATMVAIGTQFVASELANLLMALLPSIRSYADALGELVSVEQPLLAVLLLLVVIAPVGEELVFRGVVLHGFLSRYRPWIAIFLSAVLFGVVHVNPIQAPAAILLGMIFGWWRMRSDCILLCIWGHAVNNGFGAIAFPVLGWEIPGYNVTGPDANFQPVWFTALGVVLLVVGLFWMRLLFQNGHGHVPLVLQEVQTAAPPLPAEEPQVAQLPWD